MKKLILLVVITLFFVSCGNQNKWVRYELCMGLSIDSGKNVISETQWQQFLEKEIVTRFPNGFTIFDAKGYWHDQTSIYTEPSKIFMVVALKNNETRNKIRSIANSYIETFNQDAVLQITTDAEIEFHQNAN